LRWTGHSPPRPEISTKADPSQTTQPPRLRAGGCSRTFGFS
jgi:hypothetical protein